MTGPFDPAYYADVETRVSALVRAFDHVFPAKQIELLLELADHNEPGVAVEMLSTMLVETASPVKASLRDEFEALAEAMHLDASVWEQLQVSDLGN